MNTSGISLRRKDAGGFTLVEVIVTMVIFIILAAAVFGIITGVLQGVSTLQDNQVHRDQIQALNEFLKQRLSGLPARDFLISYRRNDGEGLAQNGIVISDNGNVTAIDAKLQPNGYYTLRIARYPVEVAQHFDITKDDTSITWTPLLRDVKTVQWKFQDLDTAQWLDQWSNTSTKPNLIEFSLQLAGDTKPVTVDFWLPRISPVTLAAPPQSNPTPAPHAP